MARRSPRPAPIRGRDGVSARWPAGPDRRARVSRCRHRVHQRPRIRRPGGRPYRHAGGGEQVPRMPTGSWLPRSSTPTVTRCSTPRSGWPPCTAMGNATGPGCKRTCWPRIEQPNQADARGPPRQPRAAAKRVHAALDRATAQDREISVSAIARGAGVDRSFLYSWLSLDDWLSLASCQFSSRVSRPASSMTGRSSGFTAAGAPKVISATSRPKTRVASLRKEQGTAPNAKVAGALP